VVVHDRPFGEIVIHMLAWMAEQQMAEHSAKVKNGMAQARAMGVKVGGRKVGSKNKTKVTQTAATRAKVAASWTPERRAALAARNAARAGGSSGSRMAHSSSSRSEG
jgi:DNA invertase Pin-like site-specific DNA recombinase